MNRLETGFIFPFITYNYSIVILVSSLNSVFLSLYDKDAPNGDERYFTSAGFSSVLDTVRYIPR